LSKKSSTKNLMYTTASKEETYAGTIGIPAQNDIRKKK
jgi:hypothetical protein